MTRKSIEPEALAMKPHDLWANRWFLLTAGDLKKRQFNTMTVGWGSFGIMWGKPFAQAVVRPSRYTHEFMDKYRTFTLCAFPKQHQEALQLLGAKSGRDGDKIGESGLTIMPSKKVDAPCFAEAELVVECRTIYRSEMDPKGFMDAKIMSNYPGERNFHTIYYGEVVAVSGVSEYGG